MTNREWLLKEMQNMSDEELEKVIQSSVILCNDQRSKDKCVGRGCRECKLEWLKQEHKEKIELSEAERVILENIDKKYSWIARDEDGELSIYEEKPHKREHGCWNTESMSSEYGSLSAFNHLFHFIEWEDKEPYNIEELIEASEDED